MKKLIEEELKEFHENFNDWSFDDTKEVANIFYELKKKEDYRLKVSELNSVDDYIRVYCDSWYRYKTFEGLVKSEKEQGEAYGFNEEECREQIGKSIFILKSGWHIQCVY